MKDGQHLHNRIGNTIGEHKRHLFDELKAGTEIESAVTRFIVDLTRALAEMVKNLKSPPMSD